LGICWRWCEYSTTTVVCPPRHWHDNGRAGRTASPRASRHTPHLVLERFLLRTLTHPWRVVQGIANFPLFLTSRDLLDPLPPPGGEFYLNASRSKSGQGWLQWRLQQVVAIFNKSLLLRIVPTKTLIPCCEIHYGTRSRIQHVFKLNFKIKGRG